MIAMFQAGGTVTSLMGKAPGRRRGHRALDPKREALIQETIKVFYLKPTRPSVARLVHEIRTRCLALGLPPPNWRTVKARITDLDTRAKARKRGESALLKSTMAVPGEYRASRPLEIVQPVRQDCLAAAGRNSHSASRLTIAAIVRRKPKFVSRLSAMKSWNLPESHD